MLQEEELRDAALLIFANKQDLPGALSEAAVSEKMKVSKWSSFFFFFCCFFLKFCFFFKACATEGSSLGNLQGQCSEGRRPGNGTGLVGGHDPKQKMKEETSKTFTALLVRNCSRNYAPQSQLRLQRWSR